MKITIVCDVLGEENNGTTIAAMNLIRYLQEKGHDVKILCCDQNKKDEPNYYVVPQMNFYMLNGYVRKNGVSVARPEDDIIKDAIIDADIVHVMLPFALGIRAAKLAKQVGIPVSAGCHQLAENFSVHLHMQNSKAVNSLTYKFFKQMYSNADSIHYVTPYLRQVYEGLYGKTNGYVISNGVSDAFTPPEQPSDICERINIIYTGRYSREKSHGTLINAIAQSKYANKIQLILPGAGPLADKLRNQAESLPICPKLGFIPREQMPDVLRTGYLYVHAAEIEAEGISCLEAISCGLVPIINNSPRCATKSYALTDKNTFENGNASDLATKIDYWIEHPDEYLANRKQYIQTASSLFSREKCMHQMEEMLLQTASHFAKHTAEQA